MDPKVYEGLNKAWKSTCKIIFGEEIGELEDYQKWLDEYAPLSGKRKSHISDKDTTLVINDYCPTANFVTSNEVKDLSAPLDINQIKDMDSIIEGISEKWEYAGNRVLGNSSNVQDSDAIINSHYIYNCTDVKDSSNVVSSSVMQDVKHQFGCEGVEFSEFGIGFLRGAKAKRTFVSHFTAEASDLYCSSYCMGCHDIMFTFNQRNKRNMIGNVELPRERYLELKKKLLNEIKEELIKNKRFPSILELVPNIEPPKGVKITSPPTSYEGDVEPINKGFATTYNILFKSKAGNIDDYEKWLSKHLLVPDEITSAFGRKALKSNIPLPAFKKLPEKRIVAYQVALELGSQKMDEGDIESLDKIKEGMGKIGYFSADLRLGKAHNIIKSPIAYDDVNIYKTDRILMSENVAFSYLVTESKYMYGSYRTLRSQFCINCYQSENITRGFELDSCVNCSDAMFSHNCEGLIDSMFCFNTKGKRYAIGNTSMPQDKYREVKTKVLADIAEELDKNKELKWDIFNIGCGK